MNIYFQVALIDTNYDGERDIDFAAIQDAIRKALSGILGAAEIVIDDIEVE